MWWLQLVGVIAFAMLLGASSPGGASVQRWRHEYSIPGERSGVTALPDVPLQ